MKEERPVHDVHREVAPGVVTVKIVTVSDTRTAEDDSSGALLRTLFTQAGHEVVEAVIVPDEKRRVQQEVLDAKGAKAVVLTGGTGVGPRDVTVEAVQALFEREIPGFGELFRMLSYQEVGSAAMMSRAMAGFVGEVVVFALPGSRAAVRLAAEKLILPEVGHLVSEAGGRRGGHRHDRSHSSSRGGVS